MSAWTNADVIGAAVFAWLGIVALIARFGRIIARGISAHVAATTANTRALATLTDSVNEHITSTNRAVTALDTRVTRLERKTHAA